MTDKIIISRKEIERIVKQLQNMNVSIAQSTDDLRALLDKAEVSEPVGYKVTGKLGERCSFKSNEVKKGDIIYTSPPNQSAKIAELEAEIARLKAIIEDMKVIDNVFGKGELPYGSCPVCHGAGLSRERRPNGNDKCVNGHVYPSREAMKATNDK